jgi:hypothetical protein
MQYSNDGRTSGRDASRRTNTSRGSTPRGGGSRGGSSGSYRGSSGRGDARRGGYRGSAPRGGTRGGQRDAGGARRRRSNLTGPDTGYTLHSHRVSFSRRGSFAERLATTDGRIFVVLAAIVVVVVVFAMGISSCVRSSTPAKPTESTDASADTTSTAAMSDQDGRVAAGVSNSIISQFSTELDRDEQLAQIAKRANEYTDERLLQLALDEPEAVGFVANYLDADKSSSAYTDSVTKGSVPKLFDWDERWGYVTYGDGPIAVTGSGPTTLSMAYMGLTGLNNMTAANFASLDTSSQTSTSGTSTSGSSSSNGSSSTSGSTSSDGTTSSDSTTTSTGDSALDAMIKMATGAGLTASQLSVSSSNLTGYLSETSVIAVHLKANSLTDDEHWALAVGVDSDGSVILFDPTSSSISERTWAAGTIANYSSSFMLLSVTDESLASLQSKAGSSSSSGSSASGTSGSGASASGTSSNGTSGTSSNGTSGTSSSGTSSSANGTSASGTSGSTSGTGSSSDASGSLSGSGSSGSSSSGSGNYVGLTKSGN